MPLLALADLPQVMFCPGHLIRVFAGKLQENPLADKECYGTQIDSPRFGLFVLA
jgi:hypothetical protein